MKRLLLLLGLCLGLLSPALAVVTSTSVGNTNYTALSTDQRLWLTVSFTAQRTITLPAAGATCIGQTCPASALEIIDSGAINGSNTLVIAPATGDTINGSASSITVTMPLTRVVLIPISGTNWVLNIVGPAGQSQGTATNDNACTGCVGELLTGSTTSNTNAGGTLLTTVTAANVNQVVLTAGDWDCRGNATYNAATTTITSGFTAWISSVTAAAYAKGSNDNGASAQVNGVGLTGGFGSLGQPYTITLAPVRFSLAATTTAFLTTSANFITSTASSYGFLGCRRVR